MKKKEKKSSLSSSSPWSKIKFCLAWSWACYFVLVGSFSVVKLHLNVENLTFAHYIFFPYNEQLWMQANGWIALFQQQNLVNLSQKTSAAFPWTPNRPTPHHSVRPGTTLHGLRCFPLQQAQAQSTVCKPAHSQHVEFCHNILQVVSLGLSSCGDSKIWIAGAWCGDVAKSRPRENFTNTWNIYYRV